MTRKKVGIGALRNQERRAVKRFNDNGVYIPNPSQKAPIDRHRPISSDDKARAFGMEPVAPKRLFDLPKGDAGAGQTVYRRIEAFFPMGDDFPNTSVLATNYTQALAVITNRSSTQSPKYFHVSVYGTGLRKSAFAPDQNFEPSGVAEVQDNQFENIYLNTPAQPPLGPKFIPSVCTCQARVQIHDESGQRYVDFDVIGNRTVNFYCWGVTVFILVPDRGYEVDEQNRNGYEAVPNRFGTEEDAVGCRVLPVFTNSTENPQNRTITFLFNPAEVPFDDGVVVPIPPGAKEVTVFSTTPNADVFWILDFWTGRSSSISPFSPSRGRITFEAGTSQTLQHLIPNASAIRIKQNALGAPVTGFSFVFEVEP